MKYVILILLLITFSSLKKDKPKKYIMLVDYSVNSLSSEWFDSSYLDIRGIDSGCVCNKKLNLYSNTNYCKKIIEPTYFIYILEISSTKNLNYNCVKKRQITEYSQDAINKLNKVNRESIKYFNLNIWDTTLISNQKRIPFLDSSSIIYFTRNHQNKVKQPNRFYRFFEVTALKKNIQISYDRDKNFQIFNEIENISKHCDKNGGTRIGDTTDIEIYTNMKIIKEIKCKGSKW